MQGHILSFVPVLNVGVDCATCTTSRTPQATHVKMFWAFFLPQACCKLAASIPFAAFLRLICSFLAFATHLQFVRGWFAVQAAKERQKSCKGTANLCSLPCLQLNCSMFATCLQLRLQLTVHLQFPYISFAVPLHLNCNTIDCDSFAAQSQLTCSSIAAHLQFNDTSFAAYGI